MTFGDDYGNNGLALDNGFCHVTASVDFFVGLRADAGPPTASRTRSRCPTSAAGHSIRRESLLYGQPLQWHIALLARKAGPAARDRSRRDATPQSALRLHDASSSPCRDGPTGSFPTSWALTRARSRRARPGSRCGSRCAAEQTALVASQSPPAGVAAAPGLEELTHRSEAPNGRLRKREPARP